MKKLAVLIIFLFYSLFPIYYSLDTALAFDITSTFPVDDTSAVSGDILSNVSGKGLVRSNVSYDNRIFGVINDDATSVFRKINPGPNDRPVSNSGELTVNITDFNGKISKGDYITSSPISGKGMKANLSGYVIGIALADPKSGAQVNFQGKNYTSSTVDVQLRIEFAELSTARSSSRFLETLNSAFFRSIQDPEKFTLVIRYIIAGVIAILAFGLSFLAFSRSVTKGIEAMGRNPLARQSIQLSIILQVGLTIVTLVGALLLSFLIIRL